MGGVLRGDGVPLENHRGGRPLSRVAEPRSLVPRPESLRHGYGDLSLAAPAERPDGGRGSDPSPRPARRGGAPDPSPDQRPPPGPPSADSGSAGEASRPIHLGRRPGSQEHGGASQGRGGSVPMSALRDDHQGRARRPDVPGAPRVV